MIGKGIDQRRQTKAQFAHAGLGCRLPLLLGAGRGKQDAVADVGRKLPKIRRMGLFNIDDKKRSRIFVGFVNPVQRGNLPAKWWSSVAAKDQHDGSAMPFLGQPHPGLACQDRQFEIRRRVARL